MGELNALIRDQPKALLCLQETHLTPAHEPNETHLSGYREFRAMRTGRQQGGVSTYVQDNLTVVRNEYFSNGFCKAVMVAIKELNLLVINCY